MYIYIYIYLYIYVYIYIISATFLLESYIRIYVSIYPSMHIRLKHACHLVEHLLLLCVLDLGDLGDGVHLDARAVDLHLVGVHGRVGNQNLNKTKS